MCSGVGFPLAPGAASLAVESACESQSDVNDPEKASDVDCCCDPHRLEPHYLLILVF